MVNMATTSLPPGFRFHPTDVELVVYYLKRKVMGKKLHFNAISEVDVYKNAPWDLPDKSCLKSKDLKWYFFSAREKKYANGARMKRANDYGYWKVTGKDRTVHYEDKVVGLIKTLVFHLGKPPKGNRTDWVMHEYRLEDKDLLDKGVVQDTFVLNVVFQKDGIGPRNGAQYGAPFTEEEWSDNEEINCSEAVTLAGPVLLSHNQTATSHPSEIICNATPSKSGLPDSQIYPSLPTVAVNNNLEGRDNDDLDPADCETGRIEVSVNNNLEDQNDDDLDLLLAQFTEEDFPADCETDRIEKLDDTEAEAPSYFDPEDFFKDLDLTVLADLDKVNPGGAPL